MSTTPFLYLSLITAFCSACGGLYVLFSYIMIQSMRSHRGNALLVCLSIANLVDSCCVLLSTVNAIFDTEETPPSICAFQGLGVCLATCSSALWSAAISLYILAVMQVKARSFMTKLVWGSHILCWGYPLVCGIVLLSMETPFKFEPGKWCIIREFDSEQHRINLQTQLAVLDVPVLVAMCVGLVSYVLIFYIGWRTKSQGLVGKLAFIPIVAILCRLPGFLTRLFEYEHPDDSHTWAEGLEALLDPAQGGINTIMFLLVGLLKFGDLSLCGRLCRRRPKPAWHNEPFLPVVPGINTDDVGFTPIASQHASEYQAWDDASEAHLSVFAAPSSTRSGSDT